MMQISISNVIGSRSKSAPTLGEFISVWDTSLGDGNPSIQLPLVASGNYNFSVNWGDGNTDTITAWNQAEVIHTYATNGVYTITITGTIGGWSFLGAKDAEKLISITNIGPLKLGNDGRYFEGCSNLTTIGGVFDLTGTTDFSYMFANCTSLTSVNGIGSWNTSAVTNMTSVFSYASAFNQDISGWDVSSVTDMSNMFDGAAAFNQDISGWDVSAVIYISFMFAYATSFNQDIGGWDVSAVTDMAGIFANTLFNQDISGWNVSSVTNMDSVFANASAFNQDIGGWDVSAVTYMGDMFNGATSFNQPLNSWDVSAVTAMNGMFANATSFNQPLNSWNVSFVTDMYGMFESATAFNQDISGWDVSSVTNMSNMFSYATSFNQPLDLWNVSAVTTMSGMFDGAALFNQLLNSWDVSAVIYMNNMFAYATSFNKNISVWNISNVQYMEAFMEGKSTADYSHYDDLLNAWSLLTLQNGVNWDMGTIQYTSIGSAARASIISNYSWTIDDGGLLLDPDAQAFITAASITDPTQQSAINTLVTDLKGYNIWTKFSALYPMVGGTSTSTSYNLKNTAQYQIIWNGGVTWGVNGVNGNGINGWGNTGFFFNGTTALSSHISTYIRTNSTTQACEIGSGNSSGAEECFVVRISTGFINNQCDSQAGRLNPSVADSRGLILNSRTANNTWKTYRNGSSLGTGTNTNAYLGGNNYYIDLFRRGGVGTNDLYSNKQCAFASIGDGLSDTESANFYTAVQAFQTTLGRQV